MPPVPSNAWLIGLIESNHEAAREGHVRLRESLIKMAEMQRDQRSDWQEDHDLLTQLHQRMEHSEKDSDRMSAIRIILLTSVISAGFQVAVLIINHAWKG